MGVNGKLDDMELRARLEYTRLRSGRKKEDMADALGIHINTYYKKERKPSSFKLGELVALRDSLGLGTIDDIFFSIN